MSTPIHKRDFPMSASAVIYRGPSLLDGSPIVVVAIVASKNRKTGNMVQTYILRDDMDPLTASKTGADVSICGNCPHRGTATDDPKAKLAKGRSCYVNLAQGVLMVWKHLAKGGYPVAAGHKAISAIGAGRMVRIGTYGDGAAVPSYIWDSLCSMAEGWTAYTHQSGWTGAAADPSRFMVSVESKADAGAAWEAGARTFRVIANVADVVKGKEILCPASEEMGKRATCATCKLCAGASIKAKSIAIVAHGTDAAKAAAARVVA
jgi:hypothetical protein